MTLDLILAVLLVAAALALPRRSVSSSAGAQAPRDGHWLVRKPHRVILTVLGSSLLLNALFVVLYEVPVPIIHDEFAYLLASDTFASGRLTNETHPMWKHLESFHVFQTPSYQAKYPPGQGLFLALGQVLAGAPVVGVWLSLALACAAVAWALLAVFPAGWALVGGLLAAFCREMVMWWGQTYWGGAVAMLGGALLFGAIFRFRRRLEVKDAVVLAIGVVILANTRPYEGFIVSIPSAAYVLWLARSWAGKLGWRRVLVGFVTPVCAILFVAGTCMLCYNYTLVGDPWKLPYVHYESQVSGHEIIRSYDNSSPWILVDKLRWLWLFYFGPLLTIALVPVKSILRQPESRFAAVLAGLLLLVSASTSWGFAHYTAPVACLIYAVVVQGLSALKEFRWRERPVGARLARAVPIAYIAVSLFLIGEFLESGPSRCWAHDRQDIQRTLEAGSDRHIVLVRYGEHHSFHEEWVYNRADVDEARVVWAREMDPAANRELFEYFKDRRKWLILADERPPRLVPLEPSVE